MSCLRYLNTLLEASMSQGLKSNKCYLVATALASRATCNTLWFARQKPERRGGGLWKSQGALTVLDATSTCSRENQLWSGAKSIYGYYGCLFVWVSVTFPLSFIKSIRSVEIAETFSFGQFLMWSHLQLFQLQMAPPQFFPSRGHMAMVWSPWPWPRRSLWCWVWRVRLWRAPRLGTSSPFRSRASCPAGHRPWCPTPRCGAGFDHGMAMAMLLRLGGMIGMQPLSLRSNGMEFYVVSRDAEKKAHNLVIGSERELLIFLLLVHLSW